MSAQQQIIDALSKLADTFVESNESLNAAIERSYLENNWLTHDNYWKAIIQWKSELSIESLRTFSKDYTFTFSPKKVGIIMAGNIPMVGFHDLLCTLLIGHQAIIKPSSDDKYVMLYIVDFLKAELNQTNLIEVVEQLKDVDAVIATGSNNSFRYFEQYFKHLPRLLRRNRKSIAVLDGKESDADLQLLADDVFEYFGLGCRNVSFIFLPREMKITRVLDNFEKYKDLANHNKFANNYTYHRAILLMNSEQHLDTGYALPKERLDIHAPLACLHYAYYENLDEVDDFIEKNREELQCIVGNYSNLDTIDFGHSQKPELQDFADNKDTMKFLQDLR